jgi:hypothetical protein
MERLSKRIAKLGRLLPFANQQQEMERVAENLEVTASYFRRGAFSNL